MPARAVQRCGLAGTPASIGMDGEEELRLPSEILARLPPPPPLCTCPPLSCGGITYDVPWADWATGSFDSDMPRLGDVTGR